MENIMEFVYKWAAKMAQAIINLLPTSPFRNFINSWNPPEYLGWLNWFFPVSEVIGVLSIWLASITVFYLYSIIMRWIKMIGD